MLTYISTLGVISVQERSLPSEQEGKTKEELLGEKRRKAGRQSHRETVTKDSGSGPELKLGGRASAF